MVAGPFNFMQLDRPISPDDPLSTDKIYLRAVNKNMRVGMKWIKIEVTPKLRRWINFNAILSIEQIQFVVAAVNQPNAMKMQNFALSHLNVLIQK